MAILYLGAKRFKQIISAGADWLASNREHLNKINVFPVPDGDTGSNMSMTLMAAVREMESLKEISLETTAKAAAWGALMGARGNSGVIMAQILSAFAEAIEGRERIYAEEIASAFSRSVGKAYKALLHPTEGTILTVIRETAATAEEVAREEKDLALLLERMVDSARSSVERTPLLLPKLKEAGVVDSGGLGFLYFVQGMLFLLQGVVQKRGAIDDQPGFNGVTAEGQEHSWNFRYCTEFILKGSRISEDSIREDLSPRGDSIVVVGDTRLARIHIHTSDPDDVLRYASSLGQVSSIKVDDMLVQHTARFEGSTAKKGTSVVAVVLGDGLKELFYSAGAELVIDGGPTQNPSTADMVAAIETVGAPDVVVLPNHKNIYPVAVQAAELTPKNVTVLATASAPEGLSALFAYMDDVSSEENVGRMKEAMENVKSGEILLASRSVVFEGIEVKTGDLIGTYRGKIRCSCTQAGDAVARLIESMVDESDEIITLFYGEAVAKEDAEAVRAALLPIFEGRTVELYFGGQPHAQFIVSVE